VVIRLPAPCQADNRPIPPPWSAVNVADYAVTTRLVESVNLHLSALTVNVVGDGLGVQG
jgi:hypothetical protein